MPKKKIIKNKKTKSQKKFVRKEKARIRREILGTKKQEEAIKKLYENK